MIKRKKLEDFLIERKVIYYKCLRCGHEWIPIKKYSKPRTCPKCRSAYWDKMKK